MQVDDLDNRSYYKSLRIQIFAWITAIYSIFLLPFVSTVVYGEGTGERSLNLTAGELTASFDLNQKGDITSLRHGEGDMISPGWGRPTLIKVGLVKDGTSRYFDNTDFDNFRYEETSDGVRFYYDTLYGRRLKVVATVESHYDGGFCSRQRRLMAAPRLQQVPLG